MFINEYRGDSWRTQNWLDSCDEQTGPVNPKSWSLCDFDTQWHRSGDAEGFVLTIPLNVSNPNHSWFGIQSFDLPDIGIAGW